MKTVVFVVDAIPSHIYSSLGVAKRLKRRGWCVEFWGVVRNESDRLVQSQGFLFKPLDGVWSRYQDDTRLPTDLTLFNAPAKAAQLLRAARARRQRSGLLSSALRQFEHAIDARLSQVWPDFVVVDPFLLAYYPFFRARGLPTVVLSTKPLPIRDSEIPPYDSALVPDGTTLGRTRIALSWAARYLGDLRYRCAQQLARACGLYTYHDILRAAARLTDFPLRRELIRRWIQPDLHFRSVREWALWTPETDFPRSRPLSSNVKFIGPSVDIGRAQEEPPFHRHEQPKFLIYVAVGTVRFRWKDNLAFLRKVVAAFGDVPDVVVTMSTGDERATRAIGATPPNVRVYDFLPQIRMLAMADLVITHGGAGTYRECIEREVPLLAYPRNHDQFGNAARIAYHGIGLSGDRRRDDPSRIREKAMRILTEDGFRCELRRLRAAVHACEERLLDEALDDIIGAQASLLLELHMAVQ